MDFHWRPATQIQLEPGAPVPVVWRCVVVVPGSGVHLPTSPTSPTTWNEAA